MHHNLRNLLRIIILSSLLLPGISACSTEAESNEQIYIDLADLRWTLSFLDQDKQPDPNQKSIEGLTLPIAPWKLDANQTGTELQQARLTTTFALSDDELNRIENPALALMGIGDNWTVYLNGKLLRKEHYIEDGSIIHSRYMLRAVIPFQSSLLKSQNKLQIDLLGHPPPGLAFMGNFYGLRFATGSVVGEASLLQNQQFQITKMVIYSVFLFFGLYHGLLFVFRSKDIYNLWIALFLISMSAYFFARSYYASALILDQRWILRIIYISQIVALSLFLAFLNSYFERKGHRSRFSTVAHIANGLIVLMMLVLGYHYFFSLLIVWYAFAAPQLIYVLFRIFKLARQGKRDARWMLGAVAFSVVMVLWDMIDTYYFKTNIRLLEFAILSLVLSIVGILAGHFVAVHQREENLNRELFRQKESFVRFVPTKFLGTLEKENIADVRLGDNKQDEFTILFSDIRNFTQLSDEMTAADTFRFINGYLTRMEPPVLRNNGFVDKFIGDGIMALFHGDVDHSLHAASEMIEALKQYNQERIKYQLLPINIGIGINTGNIMLGTVGGESRMDTTAIGSPVNLASRVESITKQYHLPILVTEFTVDRLKKPEDFYLRIVDRVKIRGIDKPVILYECFNSDPPDLRDRKLATRELIMEGMRALNQKNYEEARSSFYAIQRIIPEDPVAVLFLERCQKLEQRTIAGQDHDQEATTTILVIDDNPAIVDLVRAFLKDPQIKVISATSAAEGAEMFRKHKPKFTLVDYILPDSDGLSLIAKIKNSMKDQDTHNARLYLFTAEDSDEIRSKAESLGIHGFIAKPVNRMELINTIQKDM